MSHRALCPSEPYTLNTANNEWQGYAFSIGACVLFALVPWYLQLLSPLGGNLLFGYRLLVQLVCAFIVVMASRQLPLLTGYLVNPRHLVTLSFTAPLIGLQWWLFFWAPVNGYTVDMATGYFLLPLTMACSGMLVFGERMRPLQWLALIVAIVGVFTGFWSTGSVSWVTLLVCLGYPPYFILRRRLPLGTPVNFMAENLLLLPVGLILVGLAAVNGEQLFPERDYGLLLVFGAGAMSTMAMLMFVAASARLSFTVFGLLGYLEPILLMAVALLLLGEPIDEKEAMSYAMLAMAVALVIYDGVLRWRRNAVRE